ncbi:hypothetical protein Vafri_3170 [Volvox africanus]|uniref:BRCT domain-containing protein n=1 Tax=Volvox africanus TaxID=51714 RepID=A0A8J4ETK5_9CHLO|nr:hypothetical protein Vafri_3170 [Volvox africanus]
MENIPLPHLTPPISLFFGMSVPLLAVYETADDIVRRIRDEIYDIGEKPPPGSMFLGLTLLFLEMHDIPPPPAPPPRSAVPLGLLTGVADCQARAHTAAARDPRDRVEALKAAVVRHGGVVVDGWDERVTHVVMYDGIDERDEQMRLMINAERVCSGLPELLEVAAAGGDAAAISAASKEYGPEEVIEALIGVTECPADEDAAAAAEEEVAAVGPLIIGGDGGPLAARRRLSKEQSRCLSLIRAALERPRGAVEAVGAVQLVDWRWVRDSLQRVGDTAAAAARLTAAVEPDPLHGAGDAEDEEEFAEQAAAATVLGTLSELDYRPRILPPDKWLQPQQQQAPLEGAAEAGTEAVAKAGLMPTLPEREGGRDMTSDGDGGGLAEVTLPPQQRQQRAAGSFGTTLGSIWRSVLDWESDEDDGGDDTVTHNGIHTAATAVAGTSRAAVANHDDTMTRSRVSPGHEAQTADGGALDRRGLVGTGVARVSSPAPPAVVARVTLPPPDELIRLWPWERFHIDLPSPEELARLGTLQDRRRRRSDGTEASTDGATALTSGGGTAGASTDVNRGSDGGMDGSTPGQAQSGEPPPLAATRRGKANRGGRRSVQGLQVPSRLPARRRKGRGNAALGALVEGEEQHRVGDEVKGSRDDAHLSAAADASSPTVRKPPRRCAGWGGKPLRGAVPGLGRKRAVEVEAATEQAREDGEDANGAAKEWEATRRQPKRPRRAAAAAAVAAVAAQSRDEEQAADTSLLSPLAGYQRSRSRRQVHVVNPEIEDEGSGGVEVPAEVMEHTAVLDDSGGGTAVSQRSQRGVGVSNTGPNKRINVNAALTRPPEPLHPTAGEPGSEHASRAATSATDAHASPRLTTASCAAAAPQRKRRLPRICAPYSYLARQPAPIDNDTCTGTADAEACPLGPEGLPTDREPSLRHGLSSGLRRLGSSKSDDNERCSGRDGGNGEDLGRSPELMAAVICREGRVSRMEECGAGDLFGAAVAAASPLQLQAPTGVRTLKGPPTAASFVEMGRSGEATAPRPEDAGTFKVAGAGRAGGRGFMSDILSRILAENDEDI